MLKKSIQVQIDVLDPVKPKQKKKLPTYINETWVKTFDVTLNKHNSTHRITKLHSRRLFH